MDHNNIELRVLINGRRITEYPHNGQVFVEGRSGSTFEIEVFNHNHFRVEAVVSVDGLSVTDGKDAGPSSSGYLIDAGSSIRIPGWKLNDSSAAAFEFTGKGGAYATAMTGSSRNTGVIGVMAFKEKRVVRQPILRAASVYNSSVGGGMWYGSGSTMSVGSTGSAMRGMIPTGEVRTKGGPIGGDFDAVATACCVDMDSALEAAPVQNIGTGFGHETEFSTETVTFDRGDLQAMIVLYYDDRNGLAKRGIDLSRKVAKPTPNAFPGMSGCTPPPGWNG